MVRDNPMCYRPASVVAGPSSAFLWALVTSVIILAACTQTTRAETLPSYAVRPLVAESNGIVVAAPIAPLYSMDQGHPVAVQQARFRVEQVLLGEGLTAGAEITVRLGESTPSLISGMRTGRWKSCR